MSILLRIAKWGLRFLYLFLRPLSVRNKIVFFSRQSNDIPLDFRLLAEELRRESPETEVVFFCRKMRRKINIATYSIFILKSLYHLATAAVAVTDTYSIQLCILGAKKEQTIVQIWHAVGAVKQFSYQCLDCPGGQSSALARAMDMHRHYNYVLCTSEATRRFYARGFQVPLERVLVKGMPRVDYIREPAPELRERFLAQRPELTGKRLMLYLPTFREGEAQGLVDLIASFDGVQDAVLLVKPHPMSHLSVAAEHKVGKGWSTYDMMKVCDGIITDYSAASLEASLLDKPVYLYLYDYDDYRTVQGLNIDLWKELPQAVFREAEPLVQAIEEGSYDWAALTAFQEKYIETGDRNNTEDVTEFLLEQIPVRLRREREAAEV